MFVLDKMNKLLHRTFHLIKPRQILLTRVYHNSSLPVSLSKVLSTSDLPNHLTVSGWIKSARKQKKNTFLDLSDGSCCNHLQIIANSDIIPKNLNFHSCVNVTGTLVKSEHKGQEVELIADTVTVLNSCDDIYPFQPRRFVKSEFVRQKSTCKAKTNSVASLMRIRNTASSAVHEFFQNNDFIQIHTPVLTSNDCEGGGEVFTVKGPDVDAGPYWESPVHLTVSGQLHLEAMCNGLSKVYNFNPAFRAEMGRTRRHLAEFWMIEAEIAFINDLESLIKVMEDLLKHIAVKVLDVRSSDLEAYAKATKTSVNTEVVSKFINSNIKILPYSEISELMTASANHLEPLLNGDLGREHERWVCNYFGGPVAVINWPRSIKPFYMRSVDDSENLVSAVDLLVIGVGELVGGSLREVSYEKLLARTQNVEGLEWYSEMRKLGSAPTGGFGLGFERMIQFLVGVENIKDTIPFHRSPHSCIL